MYAIVRSGAVQQKVSVGDVIEIDTVAIAPGQSLSLPAVLVVDGDTVTSDASALASVDVQAEVVGATKGPKIAILKYKNKTGYRKRQGHRQHYTQVKVTAISTSDSSASSRGDGGSTETSPATTGADSDS